MAGRTDATSGSEELRALLRCPDCAAALELGDDEAVCREGLHRFPVVEGVPVLIRKEALERNPHYAHQLHYFDTEFSTYRAYGLERWRVSYLRRLRQANALGGEGAPLIDVGVGGSGYTVIEAARDGRRAIGCDLSLTGLLAARRFAASEGLADRVLFVCCSVEALPFASNSVDVALAIAVIEHVPDDGAALTEIARILRPGGRAWITVPHRFRHFSPIFWLPNWLHDRRLGHLRRYDAATLTQRCAQRGLVATEVQWTGHPIKAFQMATGDRLPASLADRLWWWCERRDLGRSHQRRGSMQLAVVLRRA